MGGGANLYSIEAISDALIGAGSIAANSQDEQQIIRGYIVPLQTVLQAECVVFYASESAQLSYELKSLNERKQKKQQPIKKSSSREVDRYIESTKLIGNVSRDLINPLTAIMGYIDLLKVEGLDDRCQQYIQKLQSQTEKMQ